MSEHLAWNVADGNYLADLLPLPMTEEALDVFCRNVDQTQDVSQAPNPGREPFVVSAVQHSSIPEWEFLATVAERTGCGILCDVNNIYVSACNHGWDASAYLDGAAGRSGRRDPSRGSRRPAHRRRERLRIDDHGSRVAPAVWALYEEALERFGPVPTLIEWDTDVPALDVLQDEAAQAQRILDRCKRGRHAVAA